MTDHYAIAAVFVLGVAIGGVSAGGYFMTNPVVETEYKTVYTTVEKPVSDEGIVFEIRAGPEAPSDWEFPVKAEFKAVVDGEWQTQYMATVNEGEPFVVDLNESTRYQISVTAASGETRILGSFYPNHENGNVVLQIGGCCSDDFS